MEFLFEFVAEFFLQILLEVFAEMGAHRLSGGARISKPNPWLASIGYVVYGALAGLLSLWAFPAGFIDSPKGRLINLVVTPLAAGGLMGALGAWRKSRGQELVRLDHFTYGLLFALAMALVRFYWAK
jgi:hypothetical protein